MATPQRQPSLFIPHGAGPCFFLKHQLIGPPGTWDRLESFLRSLPQLLPERPRALLVVSAHWETDAVTVGSGAAPGILHDWFGGATRPMPPEVHELDWPAPGAPDVARRACELIRSADIEVAEDPDRGFDHGVFVPMLLAFPDADIPTATLSIRRDLDPAHHLAIGRALAPLRDEGIAIVCSGSSFHHMSGDPAQIPEASRAFDTWLADTVALDDRTRQAQLVGWEQAPGARRSHNREEHLVPLFVAAGAAGADRGRVVFRDDLKMGNARVSAHAFG